MSVLLSAIRAKCIDCCCGMLSVVRTCHIEACALHPFRMGKNPHRKSQEMTDKRREALSERLAKARRSKSPEIHDENGRKTHDGK